MSTEEEVTRERPIAEPATGAIPAGAAGGERGATVLIVDDHSTNRDVLGRCLARQGYTVVTAADGPEALRRLAGRGIDLVLLDIMMPGMSGLEVLARVRRDRPAAELPVIMATAQDQSRDVIEALGMGANDYVTKPLDFGVVLARVRTQLSLKQSVEQIRVLERRLGQRNRELEAAVAKLVEAADRARRDLELAARVQASFLPKALPEIPGFAFAWALRPCEKLAGDSLNVCALGGGRVGMYVLDVAGHGVGAALLAVAASRLLSARDPDSVLVENPGATGGGGGDAVARRPLEPAVVAARLDERFAWNPDTEQFMTIFYAVLDVANGEFAYVSAGHPGAIRLGPSSRPTILDRGGMPIGLGGSYETQSVRLERGDRVYLYSDGVTEAMSPSGQQFGRGRVVQVLDMALGLSLRESVALLLREIDAWGGGAPARDDVSVLAFECSGA